MNPRLYLKPTKEIPVRAGHPWIFSEAIDQIPEDLTPGELVDVYSARGEYIATGSYNPRTSIAVRVFHQNEGQAIDAAWFAKRLRALKTWKQPLLPPDTNGYRLVHAENDSIPGLILDIYDDVAVFQLHTAGIDHLRNEIIAGIETAVSPRAIVERSDVMARKQEGLTPLDPKIHRGEVDGPIRFTEAGVSLLADVIHGQKTGFFLDQRRARLAVGALAKDKRVVNLFSYTGAFSLHALAGGAKHITNVDVSRHALEVAEKQLELNGFASDRADQLEADVLELLEDHEFNLPADILICDPPAFAKTDRQREEALKAYTRLNQACMQRLQPGSILVTSSCSGRVTPEDFRTMLRIAAGRARKKIRLLDWIGHDIDHAELVTFPEGRYLKTAILLIES